MFAIIHLFFPGWLILLIILCAIAWFRQSGSPRSARRVANSQAVANSITVAVWVVVAAAIAVPFICCLGCGGLLCLSALSRPAFNPPDPGQDLVYRKPPAFPDSGGDRGSSGLTPEVEIPERPRPDEAGRPPRKEPRAENRPRLAPEEKAPSPPPVETKRKPRESAPPDIPNVRTRPVEKGTVRLQTEYAILDGVVAIVEVDGYGQSRWPKSEVIVSVELDPGEHEIVVRSKYRGKYYKKAFRLNVPSGEVVKILVREVDPDPGASW